MAIPTLGGMRTPIACALALLAAPWALPGQVNEQAGEPDRFQYLDVFELERATDPQISPDGSRVAYVRRGFDIMTDGGRSALWMVDADGSAHRALTDGERDVSSPRWSPDGDRLAFVSSHESSGQIFMRWMDTGETTELTSLTETPGNIAWSPDGRSIALTMLVPETPPTFGRMPARPDGAEWNEPPLVIDRLRYRDDGVGYRPHGHTHVFVLPAEGGTPRQVTSGPYDHGGRLSWTPDSRAIVFSANRGDPDQDVLDSNVFEVDVESGEITQLTTRYGPDGSPAVSPDGTMIAYVGFDDHRVGYQLTHLYVRSRDGGEARRLTDLDRDIGAATWASDGRGLYFGYDDEGVTKVGYVSLSGALETVAENVGGLDLGRPYSGGDFSVADNGLVAFTSTTPQRPADVSIASRGSRARRITSLNEDVLAHKQLGEVEEIRWSSSFDGRQIQGWIVKPPDFDPSRRYPLLLEIHGGPWSNYGPRFTSEIQLYAAAGYVVLYTNPRGSTSYGEEFGALINLAYPGDDYEDLMSGVDAVIERGYVDEANLMVTGGSGGGVLTAWIVGKTDRFRAAVVAKPVIDWTSFSLTSDGAYLYSRYWLPGPVWEGDNLQHYWERSPLSLVGNVSTPTMLITGENDLRTPMGQSEEYYQALKLRGVPTQLVRVQNAFHGIAASSPSNLIAKVASVLEWLERYRVPRPTAP